MVLSVDQGTRAASMAWQVTFAAYTPVLLSKCLCFRARKLLRRARTARYFSNVLRGKGLAFTCLLNCPLTRDKPWVPQAGAELPRQDLQ